MADTNHGQKQQDKRKRAKATGAGESAFDRARSTVQGLEANPVGVLVGGLAVGLIAGALVPRSDREKTVLKPVGKRLAEGAVAAVAAAKATGREQLSTSVLSRDAAKESARKIFANVLQAAKSPESTRTGGEGDDRAPGTAG